MRVDVTFVMPCLNESKALPFAIGSAKKASKRLEERGFTCEILVSDNGSSDGSQDIAAKDGCVVSPCPEKGYGHALMHGTRKASGRFVVMGDSDGSYDFVESIPMIESLMAGADLCMGSRFRGTIGAGAMPFLNRYLGNPVLTGILNIFYRSGVSDAHCGMRAFSKAAWTRMGLGCGGMEYASEMVVKASLLGMRITEVPITYHPDKRGRAPHLNRWRDGWRHLKFLFMFAPLPVFFFPGLTLLVLGSLVSCGLLMQDQGQGWNPFTLWFNDHWMVLASGLIMSGYTIVMLGAIVSQSNGLRPFQGRSLLNALVDRYFSFERLALVSLFLALCGTGVLAGIVLEWRSHGYAGLARVREMVLCTSLLFLAVQSFFGGFVMSIVAEGSRAFDSASRGSFADQDGAPVSEAIPRREAG